MSSSERLARFFRTLLPTCHFGRSAYITYYRPSLDTTIIYVTQRTFVKKYFSCNHIPRILRAGPGAVPLQESSALACSRKAYGAYLRGRRQYNGFAMRQFTSTLEIRTNGKGFHDFTFQVTRWVAECSVQTGLLTLFVQHTSASLLIQENADPEVRVDLESYFDRIAPENDPLYSHTSEGPDDMPSHIRSALTQTSLSIPVINAQPALGTWQGIYLFEHRRHPHRRTVALHLIGA